MIPTFPRFCILRTGARKAALRFGVYFLLSIVLGVCVCYGLRDQVREAVHARVDSKYAYIRTADGSKSVLSLARLRPDEIEYLRALSHSNPLEKKKVQIREYKEVNTVTARKTMLRKERNGKVETIRLINPNRFFDQIGGTCMLYARVHWMDIAGYFVKQTDINKILNACPEEMPFNNPMYYEYLAALVLSQDPPPMIHQLPPSKEPFEWARNQLRMGRPILAALPYEIWMALPADFLATHPWQGGPNGHQIVLNGFTFNHETGEGSFHVVNSWAGLFEFDLDLKYADKGALVIEYSMSPKGEKLAPAPAKDEIRVLGVRLLKEAGTANLYEVRTNKGTMRVAAKDEISAQRIVLEE